MVIVGSWSLDEAEKRGQRDGKRKESRLSERKGRDAFVKEDKSCLS